MIMINKNYKSNTTISAFMFCILTHFKAIDNEGL